MKAQDNKYKLAILTSHVVQYQGPLFKKIAAHPDIDLTVLFCSKKGFRTYKDRAMETSLKWDIDLLGGYRHKFLRNYSPLEDHEGFFNSINPGLIGELYKEKFDAIIMMVGWGCFTAWLGFLLCSIYRLPFFLYGDSSFIKGEFDFKNKLKKFVMNKLFANASAFMITGTMNAKYYRYYAADSKRFFFMPWAIDNERFIESSTMSEQKKNSLKQYYGISPEKIIIIFSGKLIKRKNPMHLLQALEVMKSKAKAEIVYLGNGVERSKLEAYIRSKNIKGIHFLGFVNQSRIPEILGMSDIFVLPSNFDPRGTVVNEAMASGLPVVISNMVGVYGEGDIVRTGYNGYVCNHGDINKLAELLDRLVEDTRLREKMGKRSLEIILEWNYEKDIEGIVKALNAMNKK